MESGSILGLYINEVFYSIQGEGLHTGIPMYFIRLQGCEVGCYFCDTKESWRKSISTITPNSSSVDVSPWHAEDESDLVKQALGYKNLLWVCITGGEPYEQNINYLLDAIEQNNLMSHVETSGTSYLEDCDPDWVTLSPKDLFSKKKTLDSFKEESNEIKCVVTKQSDIEYYIKEYYPYCNIDKPLIFQPVDNQKYIADICINGITEYNLTFGRVMLQQHKIMELR